MDSCVNKYTLTKFKTFCILFVSLEFDKPQPAYATKEKKVKTNSFGFELMQITDNLPTSVDFPKVSCPDGRQIGVTHPLSGTKTSLQMCDK